MRDASNIYKDILAGQDEEEDIASLLRDINDLGATVLYPAILSAFQACSKLGLKDFLQVLLCSYVRYQLIGRLDSSRFEDNLFDIAKRLRTEKIYNFAIEILRNITPKDEAFVSAFAEVTVPDRSSSRYLLKKLEKALRKTEELDVAPPNKVHVEHIYPQTPREGERWTNHIFVVNRLGNLTLLSKKLNVSIKNAPFDQKKPSIKRSQRTLSQSFY